MKNKTKNFLSIFLMACMLCGPSNVFANDSNDVSTVAPYGPIYICSGNSTTTKLKASNQQEVYMTFGGLYVQPLDSITITASHVFTVSNTNTFNLIPELWTNSYSISYSSSVSLSQTVTNRTGRLAEFVGFAIYDLYMVTKLIELSPGSGKCQMVANGDYKVYKGTTYGYR